MPITVDNLVVVPAAGSCPALWKAKSALAFAFPLTPPSPVPCGWLPAGHLEPGVTPRWLGPPSRPRRRVDHSLRSAGFHGDLRATFGSAGTEPGSSALGAGDGTESREVKAEVAGGGGILGPGLGAAGGRLGSRRGSRGRGRSRTELVGGGGTEEKGEPHRGSRRAQGTVLPGNPSTSAPRSAVLLH